MLFQTLETPVPRRAVVNGAILSMLLFSAVGFALSRGPGLVPKLLIGARHPRPHVLPVDRSSVEEANPTTEIKIKPLPVDPLHELTAFYFSTIHVLGKLDADGDLIISVWEMVTAPAALRKVDRDRDGWLSPEECGFLLGAGPHNLDRERIRRARLEFMRYNPVLAALDANRDGVISALEIQNGSAALKSLDRNGDGLTAVEVLPDPIVTQAGLIRSRLDLDGNGSISQTEQTSDQARPLRDLLGTADRDRNGTVTEQELLNELRLRAEARRHLSNALRTAGEPER